MTINGMNTNSLMNSYLNSNKSRKPNLNYNFGSQATIGLDYAAKNTQKLQSIVERRTKFESDFANQLNNYRNTTTDFYKDFNPAMRDVASAASKLKVTTMDSTLRPTGYSSNNGAVVTDVSGTLDSGKSLDVKVSQIASGQKNTYNELSATAKGDLAGKSTIQLAVGGKKTDIAIEIDDKMTNEQALKQIADKVNAAKTGVTATVEVKDGKAQVSLTDSKTGEKSEFSAKITGKAASALGDGTVAVGTNAKYSVDGKDFTSETNKVKLADGKISATLAGVGDANLGRKNFDTENAVAAMQDFAKKYNTAIDVLNKNSGSSLAVKNLASSFGDTKYRSSELSSVGITTDSSGKLTVDAKKFAEVLKSDPERVNSVVGSARGLAGTTYTKSNEAIIQSTKFFQPPRNYNGFYGSSIGMLMDYRV